jgi:sulfur relay (sulfurtransferase) DsrF/TusC family protein
MRNVTTWHEAAAGAPLGAPPADGWLRPAAVSAAAALTLAAAAMVALGRLPLNLYDVSFSLDWGRQLIHGQLPDVQVVGASTPHPLSIASGAFAALFGDGALDAMQGVVFLAAGVVAVSLVAIGRACRLGAIGVIAALALAVSEPFVFATLGQATASDLPALAAVFAALALELARPRRGAAPLALLALAGLWRPEAWLLSVAYWAYATRGRDRRTRARLAALALSAPVLWASVDLVLTGNPLYSLTYTQTSTQLASRPTGAAHVPAALWETMSSYLATPVLVGAGLGIALDVWQRRLPRLLLWVLALTAAGFAAIGAAGLPLDDRYALPTMLLLAVFFGFFLAGWRRQRPGWLRRVWIAGALAVAVLSIVNVPGNVRALSSDRSALTAQASIPRALQQLVRQPGLRRLLARCGPVQVSYRIVPLLAYELGRNPKTLLVVDRGVPTAGSVIEPAAGLPAQLFETHAHPVASLIRRGYELAAANADWLIYTRCAA